MNEKKPFQLYNLLKVAAAMLLIITVIGSIVYNVSNKQKKSGVVSNVLDTINKQKGNNISANSGKEEKDSSLQKNSKDGTSKAISSTPLAANVQKSELFESLIASNYRSNDVEVSFPSLNHLFHTSQTLVFKITGELSEPVTLNIYNNQGKKVIGKDHILTNSFSVSNKLSPGLYYWKLLKDDDLLQVGKFIVK